MTANEHRSILVTGGTKGIGFAIASRLAHPTVTIFLSYRSSDDAAKTAQSEIAGKGADVHLIKEDVGTTAGAEALARKIAAVTPRLHGIVHSAAVANPGDLMTQDLAEIREAIEVGGMALLYIVRATSSLLGEGSSVVFLSGRSTELVLPHHGALATAKALGDCLVRYLAIECASRGINFNTLGSGPVATGLFRAVRGDDGPPPSTPSGRPLEASDVAEVAHFLLSPASRMVRGQSLLVDGGLSTGIRSS
jgi:enoyl-[acyl-carrier protein] reductase III